MRPRCDQPRETMVAYCVLEQVQIATEWSIKADHRDGYLRDCRAQWAQVLTPDELAEAIDRFDREMRRAAMQRAEAAG